MHAVVFPVMLWLYQYQPQQNRPLISKQFSNYLSKIFITKVTFTFISKKIDILNLKSPFNAAINNGVAPYDVCSFTLARLSIILSAVASSPECIHNSFLFFFFKKCAKKILVNRFFTSCNGQMKCGYRWNIC